MKVQEVTQIIIEQLKLDGVSGINLDVVMTVTIAAERVGLINRPSNTQMHVDSLNTEHKPDCELMQTGAPVCTCGAENGCQ